MYIKELTYTDYDGEVRTEKHYFHLNQAEMVSLQAAYPGGLKKRLEKAAEHKDGPALMEFFKTLVRASYGIKSEDGRRFMKSDEIWRNFAETEAYNEMFMLLVTNEAEAQAFANAVLPDMSSYITDKNLGILEL